MIVAVALPIPKRQLFEYNAEASEFDSIAVGVRVKVPFGKQEKIGIVLELKDQASWDSLLKPVIECLDDSPVLGPELLEFLRWCSSYYFHPIGEVCWAALPARLRQGEASVPPTQSFWQISNSLAQDNPRFEQALKDLSRSPRQQALLQLLGKGPVQQEKVRSDYSTAVIAGLIKKHLIQECQRLVERAKFLLEDVTHKQANTEQALAITAINQPSGFRVHLLEGVTGSGKTEVYMQCAAEILAKGKQVLILVPEISLTPQTIERFEQRFGVEVAHWHSGLSDNARLNTWQKIRLGIAPIIIGTRSAILLPFNSLGMIIIDEEHDGSFKQQDGFRYHARDIAIVRARNLNIPLVLGSATPSLESLQNAVSKKYQHLTLTRQANHNSQILKQVLDLRNQAHSHGVSELLLEKIAEHVSRGKQVLIFINRRGYAPARICESCGYVELCNACDRPMTMHKSTKQLHCHQCGTVRMIQHSCSNCGEPNLMAMGSGTQRIEEVLQHRFPGFQVLRIDSDSFSGNKKMQETLSTIKENKANILVGTQILAKGHHFPEVSLVGILDVDGALFSADFRGLEHLGQLLTQVAGRTGRSGQPSEVWLQSMHPEHIVLQDLIQNGYGHFARTTLKDRAAAQLPPFYYQILLRSEAVDFAAANNFLLAVRRLIQNRADVLNVQLAGPFPALIERRSGRYRIQLLLSAAERIQLHRLLAENIDAIGALKEVKQVRWSVDVDPVDFY